MVALPPFARRECLAHPYLPAFLQPSSASPTHTPTHSLHLPPSLAPRQWFVPAPAASFAVIPQTYTPLRSHLSPGVIVAIVLGALLGFVLLLALLWLLLGACACCGLRRGQKKRQRQHSSGKTAMRERFDSSSGSYSLSHSYRSRRRALGKGVGVRATPRGFVRKTERVAVRRAREPEHARHYDDGGGRYQQRRAGAARRGGGEDEVVVIEEEIDDERRMRGPRRVRGAPHQAQDEVVVIEENSPPAKGMRRKPTGRRERHQHRDARSEVTSATSQTGSRE